MLLTLPVPETNPVVGRSSSEIEDDSQDDESNQNHHFDRTHPELELSEDGDS